MSDNLKASLSVGVVYSGDGSGLTAEQEEQLNKIPMIEQSVEEITNDLNTKANISDIPTNTSELNNDSGFLTSIPSEYVTETEMNEAIANVSSGGSVDLSGYATKDDLNTKANISDIPTNTSELNNDSGFLTSIPSEYVTETEMNEAIANVSSGGSSSSGTGGTIDTSNLASDLSLTGSNLQLKNSQGNLIGTSITLPTNSSSEITKVSELENDSGFINADYVGNKQIVYLTQAQFNALPTKSPECMYVVTDEEDSNSDGTTVNLTNYYTKSETNSTFATKTELNNLKLQLDGKILSLYSGTSLLSSVDLSSLSSSGGDTPAEGYGNIIPSLTTVNIEEGNEITVGITLDNAPTNEQVVNVSVNNSNCTVSPETLTFTSDNYSTSQNITITGAHLSSVYTDQTSVITLSSLNANSKLINVTITNIDVKPDTGNSELTRDNLVYYADMKDQSWTKTDNAVYELTEDTNTILDKSVTVTYMEYTGGTNLDGNVIENNVLKSNSTIKSIIGNLNYNVSGFNNKKITFEFFGKIPESATETMILAEASGSFFIRGNNGKDIGIYLLTSGGNLGYFDFSKSVVDYTQPHLFSVVLDQQDANLVYKLYSDGVEILSDTLTNKTLNNITSIKFLPETRKGFEMGSLRIYNAALTDEQILANYNYETTIERVW